MTREDKELLLKDLCARLPYGTLVYAQNADDWYDDEISTLVLSDAINEDYVIKPYLFPLSSMTEEQKKDIFCNGTFFISNRNELGRFPKHSDDYDYVTIDDYLMIYKKLIKNHFDVNGLIPKGLAIDATELNIY